MSLAYKFAASWLWDVYNEVTSQLELGELERLPEVSKKKLNVMQFSIYLLECTYLC